MTSREMRSLAVLLTAALGLIVSGCPKNLNPDTPPPPSGTVLSKVGIECPFKVTASDPDFHRVSVRVDWDDGDTSDWSELFGSGDTITLGYAWPVPGDFRVSAQARDEKGAVSAWSNWHAIVIADTVELPPRAPRAPAGPDTGNVGSAYEFWTAGGDPNGDRILLQFDWGDGDTSVWSALVPESTRITMSHSWPMAGEYSVLARAKDEKGLVGEWSGVHIMAVIEDTVNRPPGIPLVPAGPDTGYVDSTYEFSTAGGDPDGDSILFQFDWGNGDTSAWSAPVPESTLVRMTHAWPAAGAYSLRARAKDAKGLASDWSDAHLLTVKGSIWHRMRMVGGPYLAADSSGFMIRVVNEGTTLDTVNWIAFVQAPDSAYMRELWVNGALRAGYPLPTGVPGIGPGDTAMVFPSFTVAPDMSEQVDLEFMKFYVDSLGDSALSHVDGKTFLFRFSDGSEITVRP
jgi:hypothetical protein